MNPWRRRLIALGLVVAVILAYGGSLRVPLIFDDHPAIERNETIRQLWPLTPVLLTPVTGAGATGRPLVNLSLAINYAWGGLNVTGYHVFNLTIHALAGLVLWGLLRRTLRKSKEESAEAIAAWTALLWLLHPLLTESVICIVQRNELLAGLFFLLTLYAFARSVETGEPRRWQAVMVIACLAGVMSKELVATAPLMVLLYDRTFVARSFGKAWRSRWRFYLALALTWVPLAWLMVGTEARAGTVGFGLGTSVWSYLLTQCKALGIYLKLAVWPHPLVLDYGVEVVPGLSAVWPQAVLIGVLLGFTVWALWKKPVCGFWAHGFCDFSAEFEFCAANDTDHSRASDVSAVDCGDDRGRSGLPTAEGSQFYTRDAGARFRWTDVSAHTGLSHRGSIWSDTLAKQPGNARAHASLGHIYAGEQRWDEAASRYAVAVQLRPDYADAQNDYANVLLQLGRKAEAVEHYEAAWRLKPDDVDIRFNLAGALAATGRAVEAARQFEAVVQRDAGRVSAWSALGDVYLQAGQTVKASEALKRAVQLRPEVAELHYNLGNVQLELGRLSEALTAFGAAVRLRPEWAAAQNNLALALMRARRPADAVPHYEIALRLAPGMAQVHQNLALALGDIGRIAEAIQHDEAVLRLEPDNREARDHLAWLRRR